MRRTTFGLLTVGLLTVSGCGSGSHFANHNRPPTPVDLTVYINDSRVSVSPASVGAGPIIFFVTNQASKTESLSIRSRSGEALATTGPINPQATTQVQVNFTKGVYKIGTGKAGATDAALATSKTIQAATLHIGPSRPSADNALLQP